MIVSNEPHSPTAKDNQAKIDFITELVDTVIESHDLSEWGDHEVYFLARDIKAALSNGVEDA